MDVSGIPSTEGGSLHNFVNLVEDATTILREALPVPYEKRSLAMLVYHVAKICSLIASRTPNPSRATATLLICSTLIAFEAILWVVADHFLWFVTANATLLFIAMICYHKDIHSHSQRARQS
ncbi:hypothetical protein HN51_061417 [Arachis hypogaea]|uniref:uncharacterized protein LOC107610977 n=1 Tax=Arachis ipaensis TaxID=130454 RepID=UPI0007AF3E39|nr:uncharacterized protein LOC107610977 [Arachis ipaensis]XP_025626649.1 uncharacterized protein LOC112720061 [Arachis hypogaea]QHO18648.1 uncharacterized protein DS421_11g322330 [Arachis hypogaea]